MLDLSPEQFRELGYRVVDILAEQLAAIRDTPTRCPVPDDLREQIMNQPLPVEPRDPSELLEAFADTILPYPMGNQSPRFFAWVNSPAAPLGVLAELLAAGLDPSVAGGDHAATYVEHAVLRWMKHIVGVPSTSGAILTSGGSVANLIGLTVMRHVKTDGQVRARGLADLGRRLVVYTSTEGHSCLEKDVELLGIGGSNLRRVSVDQDWRLEVCAL